ncbi:unnamed protein product [Medioppia subpectinata]|uniref:Uncharacterized protein n=1 Tax=Medioppia subpectinata TaxID=1979941 RepID=A0A7R9PXZ5_9ACAR|nr:unnamed protein product [Medioppia subpectinata]CAG2105347.1 unnamed protein product [Medioppia subpectinata]
MDPIETLDDLVGAAESGKYGIITLSNSAYYDTFALAECCGAYHTIGEAIKTTEQAIKAPDTTAQGIQLIIDRSDDRYGIIFINTHISLAHGVRSGATVDMHISAETLMMDHMGMALQKGSPLLNHMNNVFCSKTWRHYHLYNTQICNNHYNTPNDDHD